MFQNNSRIKRIDPRVDLDPDFGNLQPDYAEAYQISVTPKKGNNRYNFITLIPETGSEEESIDMLSDVMDEFLVKGDKYTVREFTDQTTEEYIANGSYGPIISFDPKSLEQDKIAFLWLVPPKHLML